MSATTDEQEKAREDLLSAGLASPTTAEALRRYTEAMSRMPAPVMINTGVVRYSTGGNA